MTNFKKIFIPLMIITLFSALQLSTKNANAKITSSIYTINEKPSYNISNSVSTQNQSTIKQVLYGANIGRPGPILSTVRIVNGRKVCSKKNDHPHMSRNGNPPGHVDTECCLDPDETPNSLCYYPSPIYAKYLQRYLNSQR